jgi:hypothetical protein
MDLKRFALGFMGYGVGAVLETVMIIIFLFVSFTLFGSWGFLVLSIGVLGMITIAFKVLKSGAAGRNMKPIIEKTFAMLVFSFVLIFGVILWQMGPAPPRGDVQVTAGFVHMQPLSPSIAYRNTSFTCAFTNALGTTIKLINVSLNESIAHGACTVNSSDVRLNLGSNVKAGGTLSVTVDDCPAKADREAYDMVVTIMYNANMGGITTNHTDAGHIKGQGEPL